MSKQLPNLVTSSRAKLWNAQKNKLNSENRKAMATNGKLKRFLLSVQSAYRELCERSVVFTASGIKEGAVPFHPLSVLTANR
mgnify:CR=1 FL=1